MRKILIASIMIIVIVITSDAIIKKMIYSDFDYIISSLDKISAYEDNEYKMREVNNLDSFIKSKNIIMAFYIDHGEIEQIKAQLVIIKAGIRESDSSFLYEEIKRTIFIIEHLKEKIEFNLENIL